MSDVLPPKVVERENLPVHGLVYPYDEEPDTEPCGCQRGTPVQQIGDHTHRCTRCGHVQD